MPTGSIQDGQIKKKKKQKLLLGRSQRLASWSGQCPLPILICLLFFCGADLGRSHATACDSLSFSLMIRHGESTATLAPPALDTSSDSPSISSPPSGLGAYGLGWQQIRETCQSVVLNKPIFHPALLSLPPSSFLSFALTSLFTCPPLLFILPLTVLQFIFQASSLLLFFFYDYLFLTYLSLSSWL